MSYQLSEYIYLVLKDNDEVWPTTVDGHFRLITQSEGHNILGRGENSVSEDDMIDGVLNGGFSSRWRSKTNKKRKIANHFSINSPSVIKVCIKVGNTWVNFK